MGYTASVRFFLSGSENLNVVGGEKIRENVKCILSCHKHDNRTSDNTQLFRKLASLQDSIPDGGRKLSVMFTTAFKTGLKSTLVAHVMASGKLPCR